MDFLTDFCSIANAFCDKQLATRGKGGTSYLPPGKLEHLYGCAACAYNEMGCRYCWDNPFATRPTARAKPGKGHYQNHVPAAPTFRPTAEQFKDPFGYLAQIAPEAQKAGIALIIPPEGWEPPIQLLDQQTGQLRKDFKVPVRIQPTHLLCKRHPTPSGAPPVRKPHTPTAGKDPGASSSDGTVAAGGTCSHNQQQKKSNAVTARCSKAGMEQSHGPKSNAVAGRCSKAGMEQQKAGAGAAEQGKKDVIMNPAHWDAVAAAAEATDGQFGYEHLEDPLNLYNFHRYADWAKRRHFNGPLMAGSRKNGAAEAAAADPAGPLPIQTASSAWRSYPCTPTARAARGVPGKWIPGTATEAEYNYGADWAEPSIEEVEAEFWRIVESPDEQVEALYGQDIDTATYSSAFPTIKELAVAEAKNLLGPSKASSSSTQQSVGDAEDTAEPADCFATCRCGSCQLCTLRTYTKHPWNINNLPQAKGSVLRFVREDVGGKPITGLMVPWVYVGSCFSAFCWHIEDHGLYSINYNHMGAPKVWYGVPATAAGALDATMRDALPHLFARDKLLLHKLVTMMSPTQLMARGVPVCRAVQVPGSFVVTFPDAYHAGFNSGFNVAEAVNFAAPDWLPFGSSSVVRYRCESRYMTFSHDAMLINVVRDATTAAAKARALLAAGEDEQEQKQEGDNKSALLSGWLQPAGPRGLKAAFAAGLESMQHRLIAAEADAADKHFKQQQENVTPPVTPAEGAAGDVRLVGPAAAGSSGARSLAVLLSNSLLDSKAWLEILPEEAWAEAAAVADEAAALIAAEQQQQSSSPEQQQQVQDATPQQSQQQQQQQQQGPEHHLAAASQQHHGGQRERVFTMRGGNSGPQPADTSAAAAAAAGSASSSVPLLARTARGLAAAVFARKKPKATALAAGTSSISAAAWVDTHGEAAVAAITEYILSLADGRRQRMLVEPPSEQLARLAVGELALRLELESLRQKALMLTAGVTRVSLMQGTAVATHPVTGVHINTKGVECATCGCDLSLAAVVSESDAGRAVCPEHFSDLDGTRSECYLLLRYMPGQLEQLLAKAVQLLPGAKEAVQAARARKSWVAAGRFMGSVVLQKPAEAADTAAVVVKQEQPELGIKIEQQEQQQQLPLPQVVAVKLLGKLYDPSELNKKLFEDLDLLSVEGSDDESDTTNGGSSYQNNKLDGSAAAAQQLDDNSGAENQSSGSWFGDQNLGGHESEDEQMQAAENDSVKKSVGRKRVRMEGECLGRMSKRPALVVQA